MLKPIQILSLAALLFLSGCSSPDHDTVPLDPEKLPYIFAEKELYSKGNSATHFIDLDGDGIEARVTITFGDAASSSKIVSTRYNGTTISTISLPPARSIRCQFAQDMNNDGYKELFLLSREGELYYLTIVNVYASAGESTVYRRFPLRYSADTLARVSADDLFALHGLIQKSRSAAPLILASYSSEQPAHASYLLGIDASTGELAWRYGMGPRPAISSATVPPESAPNQFFFGTTSRGTETREGETDDEHTYVVALAHDGTTLWKPRVLGGAFASAHVFLFDINGRGDHELLCFFSSSNRQVERSFVKVLDPANGAEIGSAKEFPQRIILADDLPVVSRDGKNRFVVCTYSGALSLFDENMKVIREQQLPAEAVSIQVSDVFGDAEKEIIAVLRTGKSLILDQELEPIALLNEGGRMSVSRCNSKTEQMIVLGNDKHVIVGHLVPRAGLFEDVALWGAALLGVLIIGFISYRSFLYLKIFRTAATNSQDIAIVLLNGRGKILMANPVFCANVCVPADRAVGKRWDICLDREYHKPLREVLSRVSSASHTLTEQVDLFTPAFTGSLLLRVHPVYTGTWRLGTFITMHDITKVLRTDQMVNWASIAHSLAHEMKTPLSTIWFTLARIRQEAAGGGPANIEGHLESIEEEVRRVDNHIKGFMKLANVNPPNAQPVDLNAVLAEILSGFRAKLPNTTTIQTDFSADIPAVYVDVNLFTVAIRNLLDNAVTAMHGRGVLKVSTYLVQNLNASTVHISLSDTGSGIAEEDIPKVFQPYFSKAEGGTGLGLVITKKIIEDHEGRISFTTQPGLGTEFVIQLPVPGRQAGGGTRAS